MKTCNLVSTDQATMSTGDTLLLPCTVNYYYITTEEQAREAAEELLPIISDKSQMIAVDVETTGLDPLVSDIILAQIGTSENKQYVFDMRSLDYNIIKHLFDGDCWKMGHNLKFDGKFLRHKFGISLNKLFDTILAEMVIKGGMIFGDGGNGLDAVIKRRLGKEMRIISNSFTDYGEEKQNKAKKQMQLSFLSVGNNPLTPAQLAYAANDVAEVVFKVANSQTEDLYKQDVNTLYSSDIENSLSGNARKEYIEQFPPTLRLWETAALEFKFLDLVIDMELEGIGFSKEIHAEVLDNLSIDYKKYRMDFLKLIAKTVPQRTLLGTAALNPDSNKQVLSCLNRLGLELPDTNSKNLEQKLLSTVPGSLEYNILQCLLNYRTTSKLVQAFGPQLASHVHPVTGRIHFNIKQILDTGRISNSDPNLQQIPSKIEWRKTGNNQEDSVIEKRAGLRDAFVARPGNTFLIYDYDSQELRVAASISMDKTMIEAFVQNKNLHCYSATLMYDEEYEPFYKRYKEGDPDAKEKRTEAKTVSFGSLYGSGPGNLSKVLNVTYEKAKEIIKRFWGAYPVLSAAMKRYGIIANKVGYSNTVLGRRRYYINLRDRIRWIEAEHNISSIQKRMEDEKMKWFFEEHGAVTYDNMDKAKTALIRKYQGDIERQAGNHHIQGTSADMTKLAAIQIKAEIKKKGLKGKVVGLVHDEIITECPLEEVEVTKAIVESKMCGALNYFCPTVPAAVEGKVSACWRK